MDNNQNNKPSQTNISSPYSIYYSGPQQQQQNYQNYQQPPIQYNQQSSGFQPAATQLNQQQISQTNQLQPFNTNSNTPPVVESQEYSNSNNQNTVPQQYNQFFNNQIPPQQQAQQQFQNYQTQIQPNQNYQQIPGNNQIPVNNYPPYNYNQQQVNQQLIPYNNSNQQYPALIPNMNSSMGINKQDYSNLLGEYYKYERNPPEPFKSSINRVKIMSGLGNFALLMYVFKHSSSPTMPKMKLFGQFLVGYVALGFITSSLLMVEYKKAFDYSFANKDTATIRKELDLIRQEKVKVL